MLDGIGLNILETAFVVYGRAGVNDSCFTIGRLSSLFAGSIEMTGLDLGDILDTGWAGLC